ncbi:hypothetical protein ONZ45_g17192 [Pleurotus djamor]|nr:hypothetical protein ONZ45_g17192 [Pleurotus djamor]
MHRSGGGDWITHNVTVAQAEKMLGTKYGVYQHPETGAYLLRTLSYSLPRDLHTHVDVISPTTYFATTQAMKVTSFLEEAVPTMEYDVNQFNTDVDAEQIPASCAQQVTPTCLRLLYNLDGYTPQAMHINKLGITGYLNEHASSADLQEFYKRFKADAAGSANFSLELVNSGRNDEENPGTEANLDVQYAMSISYPTPAVFYSTGGSPPYIPDDSTYSNTNEPYLDWLEYILHQPSIPQTFTTSYGDDEQTVPVEYQVRVCTMFAQLGARGSSVIFSSGDYGVGPGLCYTNDGLQRQRFIPHFPGTCPYVTAVGGTGGVPERTAGLSGGGFSNTFQRPSYQETHVGSYLSTIGDMYSDLFNSTGRGFPDVSAQARGYQMVHRGDVRSIGGTSAAAPVVAGIVALLNDYQLSRGKPPLGFLNPWLYSKARGAFNDIVKGSNPGCRTMGFPARPGWDPVTGLGTPDFQKLKALLD